MFVILTEMFCMTYDLRMTAKFLITSKYFQNVGKSMNGDKATPNDVKSLQDG